MGLLGDIFMALLEGGQNFCEKNYDKAECFKGLTPEERAEKEQEIQAKLDRSRAALKNVKSSRSQNND